MKNRLIRISGAISLASGCVVFSQASARASTITPANNSFESPAVTQTGYPNWLLGSDANGSSWVFPNGNSGIVHEQGGEGYQVHNIPDGSQAALLQAGDGTGETGSTVTGNSAVFEQSLSGFTDGTASVSFYLEARDGVSGYDPVSVYLDGTLLSFTLPGDFSNTSFSPITTDSIPITAGSHTLFFVGAGAQGPYNGSGAFIDLVTVDNAVPEPASLGLITLIGGAGLLRRRRSV